MGLLWLTILILSVVSAIFAWINFPREGRFNKLAISLFLANGLLNIFWSYLVLRRNLVLPQFFEALAFDAAAIGLIILIWPLTRLAFILLWPYAVWIAFAVFMAFRVLFF